MVPRLLAVLGASCSSRDWLLLVALEDLSYDEVARILGVPAGTVMSRLSRARGRMRAFLDQAPTIVTGHLRRVK